MQPTLWIVFQWVNLSDPDNGWGGGGVGANLATLEWVNFEYEATFEHMK